MKIYLATGVAGFIGANYQKYILNKYKNVFLIVLDKLIYVSNLKNIENSKLFLETNIIEKQILLDTIKKYKRNKFHNNFNTFFEC